MRKKWKTHKVCGRNRSARRINGFTQGVESQPLPLIHVPSAILEVMASVKTGLDNSLLVKTTREPKKACT